MAHCDPNDGGMRGECDCDIDDKHRGKVLCNVLDAHGGAAGLSGDSSVGGEQLSKASAEEGGVYGIGEYAWERRINLWTVSSFFSPCCARGASDC